MTNYSRSVLKSNGLRHSENLPVKFGFSPQIVPANIVKKLPLQLRPKPFFIAFFNFSHKQPTFAFMGKNGYTLGFRRKIAHKGTQGETRGVSDGGWYHYPRSVPHVHQHPRAGYQNGKFCRFWGLAGGAPEERRKPAGRRCAYARRCSEASWPRWAALLCLQFGDVAVFSLRVQYFLNVQGGRALSLPSERFTRFGNPAWPWLKTANFAALGSWPGGALEERRKPSGQRCAYACRCSEASRPRWTA